MKALKNYRFPIILLISIIIGAIIGIKAGEDAIVLKPIGDVFLNLLFTVIVPLIFFTIASSIANMNGTKKLGKIMKSMVFTFLTTGLISAVYMFAVLGIFNPTEGANINMERPEAAETLSLADQVVKAFTVTDFVELFSRDHMLALIIISLLVGFATQALGEKGRPFASVLNSGSEVMMKMVSYIMYLAPLGLGAYFATLVGQYGPILLGAYLQAGVIYYVSAFVYFGIAFTAYAYYAGRQKGVKVFWKNMLTPSVTALATCSSAATLPVNLEATKKMGISKEIRETTIPLGTALHKDGSVMGGVMKMVFLFGVFGQKLDGIGIILMIIGIALLVGIVMGAIPSGGMIGEMLILSLFGLPPEALPIIAAISTLIDPPATLLNATGDNAATMMIARQVEGKDWYQQQEQEEEEEMERVPVA